MLETLLMGALLLGIMLLLLAGGVWIAMTLAIVGWVGQAFFTNTLPGKNLFSAFWESNASWELAALPLFIWMGEILFRTKLSEEMFEGLRPWLNRVPGRLMHTTILGCGVFGSVSGSSAATCATIAKVALPELKRRGYNEKLAIGSLATAGTLGILIPPSITMVVYAVAADASIIRIFLAGFLPGFLLMLLFSGYIGWWSLRHPDQVPPADPPTTFMEKIRLSGNLIPCALLIVFIVWVLVAGWATATECAAFGVLGSLAIAAYGKSLTWQNFKDGIMGATRTSCMIMFILAGAAFLTKTMAFTGIPRELAEWVDSMHLSPYALIGALVVVYLVLGTALDGISMIVLTSAVVLPMIQKAGFDLVWFGIFVVLLVEIAEVTPPVGFNLFVLQNMTGKDSNVIAKAAIPFFFCLVLCIALITLFPGIVTILPDLVMGKEK
ncbi:TRAP transporter large permease [Variovorax boronicumulans]|uniref:TRAP transporter large permease protein n=3 Tax=Variovorax boronicumulans TaxID=436515 RepID=A0AAW8E1Z2_9BURK|nr:TRAP transporter large permease subunit [Variovorax boronicumulans]MDP9880618.1 tripartite ATP-independent transporter DctM subunit [Variovorax boronicumulans]MDP9916978.1 tripartite ATP-independent transporter DctM subunit [Variovorax boronicumulans]MDP9925905.1 tripartite ATP-independent transporter DctM subunit [Variovorax boronicumulans]GER12183.1 C4-dicarboxylate ABC transporter permease [Variovorax boronicumulans]